MDCLIVVTDINNGLYYNWRGIQDGVRAVLPTNIRVGEDDVEARCEMWACYEKDVDAVIAKITAAHVGAEVKAFKIFKTGQRAAGPIVIREVTKDGVLPF
jgi:hypothetical protein